MTAVVMLNAVLYCRSLTKLEWVLLETLRLKPPAYLVGRCCYTSVQLQQWSLQEGGPSVGMVQAATWVGLCCCAPSIEGIRNHLRVRPVRQVPSSVLV